MSYIQTFSGRKFDVVSCELTDIHIEDIAHGLSNTCRFAGQVPDFYSVAQHCVLMADEAPRNMKLAALLHDASEAYMGDMSKHLKDYFGGVYKTLEDDLMRKIAKRYRFPWPMPQQLKQLDLDMLQTEFEQIWEGKSFPGMPVYGTALAITIKPWLPYKAERIFLDWFQELST